MLDADIALLRRTISNGGTPIEIDQALAPVASARDPRAIGRLLTLLNDDLPDEGLWSVVHAAEQFDDRTYVSHFLSTLPDLVVASKRWASILIMRALNSDATRMEIVCQIREADVEVRRTATLLCEQINERDIRFLAKTTPLLVAASNAV